MPELPADRSIRLIATHHRAGMPTHEMVAVHDLGEQVFRITATPVWVLGLAAGDEIQAIAGGTFKMMYRGGNLAVQVFAENVGELDEQGLVARVQELGGRLEFRHPKVMAFTIPAGSGFDAVEHVFDRFAAEHGAAEWVYGNVYDARGKPLNWWR